MSLRGQRHVRRESSTEKDNEVPLVGFKKSTETVGAAVEVEEKRLVGIEMGEAASREFIQGFIGQAKKCKFQ